MNKVTPELLSAYENTNYIVTSPGYETSIHVGELNNDVVLWLKDINANCAAFLTAYNPDSNALSDNENKQRHEELISKLKSTGIHFLDGYGKGLDTQWPAETSLLIGGSSRHEFDALAASYGQAAYVYIDTLGNVELIEKSRYITGN